MPRLLTTPRKGRRKVPPCGRIIEYSVPHSPFQKLIDAKRQAKGWSFRTLAKAMTELGARTTHTGLWIWLHCQAGYPAPRNFKTAHIEALSEIFKIPMPQLRAAYDASRHVFTAQEKPMPQGSQNVLEVLLGIFRCDRRKVIRTSQVVNIIERLRDGLPIEE